MWMYLKENITLNKNQEAHIYKDLLTRSDKNKQNMEIIWITGIALKFFFHK